MNKHCEPAKTVIEVCGGVAPVALATGKDQSTVRRWQLPEPSGTGGLIPAASQQVLLDSFSDLRPDHFFERPDAA